MYDNIFKEKVVDQPENPYLETNPQTYGGKNLNKEKRIKVADIVFNYEPFEMNTDEIINEFLHSGLSKVHCC